MKLLEFFLHKCFILLNFYIVIENVNIMNRIEKIFELIGIVIPSVIVAIGSIALICAILFPEARHQFFLAILLIVLGSYSLHDELKGK